MPWAPALPSLLAFGISAAFGALAAVGWRHRGDRCAGAFTALTVVLGLWSLCYAVQLGYTTIGQQLPWWRAGIAVGSFVAPLWALFGLRYAGKADWITPNAILLLFAEPSVFVALVYTNTSHGLVWSSLSLDSGVVAAVSPVFASGYYLHVAYQYGLIAFGSLLVLGAAYHSLGLYRRQAVALMVVTVPPILASLSYTVGSSPVPGVDLTPFASALTLGGIAVALFQFDLLDRTPIAREEALSEAGGGLLVLDADEVVVDADNRARQLIDNSSLVGRPFSELFPDASLDSFSGTLVEARTRGSRRYYEGRVARLNDDEGKFTGYSVVFRDVTDRRAYEQRLEVANRVLRHNLRNDMNLVQGIAARIESGESEAIEADARLVRKRAERVVELGEKARVMTRTDPASRASGRSLDLVGPATQVLAAFTDREPTARFEQSLPESLPAVVVDESALVTALEELVENAIEHSEDPPLVRLEGERSAESVSLRIIDDGPGIPESESQVLDSGTETPLQHGQGMGLWLAYWSAQAAGGELSIERCTEEGSVVELRFPATDA